ncbi:MAG: polysaccharide biosynthesis/export family protein [Alphaproteobacteria bacterium]
MRFCYHRTLAVILTLLVTTWATPAVSQTVGGAISGDRVDVAPEREAPKPLSAEMAKGPPPFGFNLFTGGFRAEREDGLNPQYIVQPGDQMTVRIWGATSFDGAVVVDAQGNIFVPEVGPIRIEGARNSDLTTQIERAVRRVFTQNINVYAYVQSTTPVTVYVTGYVKNPGSYAGVASDSLLYFLDRAGGVDAERGSYRDIRCLRNGKLVDRADLYEFLMEGKIPRIQFQDGDTIVVGPRGETVSVQGAARNRYTFEFLPAGLTGEALIGLARPQADASHAVITGTRRQGPASAYLTLSAFEDLALQDGDEIIFEADEREDTMMIRVEGSHLGPSRFAVPRHANLKKVLDYIEVDPRLADTNSISLKRQSIAERQRRALKDTLRRLEAAVLSATSQTDEESQIRASEAKLIADFVERAREVEPDGVLVVVNDGHVGDIQLQHEDVITIPERSDVVLVSGEVAVPQAIVYRPGDTADDYIARVGGYTNRADEQQLLVVRRSGEVLRNERSDIRPGDEIMVMPEVPVKNLQVAKTITEVIFKVMFSAGVFLGI